ncbi:MAG: hypothetical protein Q9176_007381 [Flavoplaca citrina]
MTWDEGVKNFFSTYFATRRMWPIGYILGSPYSPLRAELEMPSKNWRDAFEDLLALENGRDMIREDIRKAEDDHGARRVFNFASFAIAKCNHDLNENQKLEAEYRATREEAVKHNDHRIPQSITDDLLPYVNPKRHNLPNDPLQRFEPSKSSIVYQEGECDLVKMSDGSTGPSVKIRNVMVDGTIQSKTFAQDPEGLFDEIQGAADSMRRMHEEVKKYVSRSPRTSQASRKEFLGDESQEIRLDDH